jgi:hypothetical protein
MGTYQTHQETNKATCNVTYLLQSIAAQDKKEHSGVLKKRTLEICQGKQTTIWFVSPVADTPSMEKTPHPHRPPSVVRQPAVVAAINAPPLVALLLYALQMALMTQTIANGDLHNLLLAIAPTLLI